jgi:hypothetical protein
MNESDNIHNIRWTASRQSTASWIWLLWPHIVQGHRIFSGCVSERNMFQAPDSSAIFIRPIHNIHDIQSDVGIRRRDRQNKPEFNKPTSRLNSIRGHGRRNNSRCSGVLTSLQNSDCIALHCNNNSIAFKLRHFQNTAIRIFKILRSAIFKILRSDEAS